MLVAPATMVATVLKAQHQAAQVLLAALLLHAVCCRCLPCQRRDIPHFQAGLNMAVAHARWTSPLASTLLRLTLASTRQWRAAGCSSTGRNSGSGTASAPGGTHLHAFHLPCRQRL